jgi:hypothetical protein
MYCKIVFWLEQFIKKYYSRFMWMFPRLLYQFYRLVGDIDLMSLSQIFVIDFLDIVVHFGVVDYI